MDDQKIIELLVDKMNTLTITLKNQDILPHGHVVFFSKFNKSRMITQYFGLTHLYSRNKTIEEELLELFSDSFIFPQTIQLFINHWQNFQYSESHQKLKTKNSEILSEFENIIDKIIQINPNVPTKNQKKLFFRSLLKVLESIEFEQSVIAREPNKIVCKAYTDQLKKLDIELHSGDLRYNNQFQFGRTIENFLFGSNDMYYHYIRNLQGIFGAISFYYDRTNIKMVKQSEPIIRKEIQDFHNLVTSQRLINFANKEISNNMEINTYLKDLDDEVRKIETDGNPNIRKKCDCYKNTTRNLIVTKYSTGDLVVKNRVVGIINKIKQESFEETNLTDINQNLTKLGGESHEVSN